MLSVIASRSTAHAAARISPRLVLVTTIAIVGVISLVSSVMNTSQSGAGDDAYITYRYAANIARGDGFRFNPGGPAVLGTTTPLYTLMLAAGAKLGADIPELSLAIGAIALAVALSGLVLLGHELGFAAAGVAAALTWSLSPVPIQSVVGMETPVYIAFIVVALYLASTGQRTAALSLGALAALTRPDGLAILVAVAALFVFQRTWSWRAFVPAAVMLGLWSAYATLAFGSPIPTSGIAKMVHDAIVSGTFSLLDPSAVQLVLPIMTVIPDGSIAPFLLGLLFIGEGVGLGAMMALRSIAHGRILLLWLALYLTGYSFLHMPNFPWYYAPAALITAFVMWAGLEHVLSRLVRSRTTGSSLTVVLAGSLGLASLLSSHAAATDAAPPSPHVQAGLWLRDHASPGQSVAAYEVGTIAYLSNLQTTDLLGLTAPEALPYVREGDYAWAIRAEPDYVFVGEWSSWPVIAAIYAEPVFAREYRIVARFAYRQGKDYLLYQHI